MKRLTKEHSGPVYMHYIARDLESACKAATEFYPERTDVWHRGFAKKAQMHFDTDYDGARGLSIVGLGRCPTFKMIEFTKYSEEYQSEVEFIVIALGEDGPEAFDREEALGYDRFIKSAWTAEAEAIKKQMRETHFERKRREKCED